MEEENKARDNKKDAARKRPLLRKTIIVILFFLILMCAIAAALVLNNNVSLADNQDFGKDLDDAIEKCLAWTQNHKETILTKKNIALIKMLREIETLSPSVNLRHHQQFHGNAHQTKMLEAAHRPRLARRRDRA